MGKNQHVVPHNGGWTVKGEGNRRVTSVHETQAAAIEAAKEIARNEQTEVVIHGRDGRIRDKESYGKDRGISHGTKTRRVSPSLHVVPHDSGWKVRREGTERAISLHATQAEARQAARAIAKNQGSEVVIHRADGRIRERERYGTYPLPSKSPREVLFPQDSRVTDEDRIKEAVKELIMESLVSSERQSQT